MQGKKEAYFTIGKAYGPMEFREKGSRFISYLFPVRSVKEVDACIARLRKEYRDSSHACFAFRLGDEGGEESYFRYNDDGEPGGTAGLPIYNEIKSKEYLNIAAAVVRYFGGTKLGTGGLVRAYGTSARKVLDLSEAVTVVIKQEISFDFPYDLTGEIMQVVNRFSLDIINREYGAGGVSMKLAVPVGRIEAVAKSISDKSGGKIKIS
ncbi:MAG: YigZ family protein [bacterium]|nr:YigZ family protein [bacterium]